jgi:hypothetical protein
MFHAGWGGAQETFESYQSAPSGANAASVSSNFDAGRRDSFRSSRLVRRSTAPAAGVGSRRRVESGRIRSREAR